MKNKTRNSVISIGSIVALIVGFTAGILFKNQFEANLFFIDIFRLFGAVWVGVLMVLVIPLTSSYLVDVVLSLTKTSSLGKVTGYAFLVHTLIFLFGMAFSVATSFAMFEIIGENLPRLSVHDSFVADAVNRNGNAESHVTHYLGIAKAIQKQLGKILLFFLLASVVFAFIISKLSKKLAGNVHIISRRISTATMKWLQYYLLTLPVAVLCLFLPVVIDSGFSLVGVAGFDIVVLSLLLVVFIAILYGLVWQKGNIPVKQFAKGMIQPQLVAASTRSSLATIPSLLEVSESKLEIPKSVSATIIPFFISVFRMNRAISSPFHYIFLIYVYGLELSVVNLLIFLGLQVIISFGSPGIPSSGKMTNMPLYLAAGIPLEGYILLKAVDAIPDIFKTLLNVTQVMTVISIVGKKQNWTRALSEIK